MLLLDRIDFLRRLAALVPAPAGSDARGSEERLDAGAWESWDPAEAWPEVEFVQEGELVRGSHACVCVERHRSYRAPPV